MKITLICFKEAVKIEGKTVTYYTGDIKHEAGLFVCHNAVYVPESNVKYFEGKKDVRQEKKKAAQKDNDRKPKKGSKSSANKQAKG